MRVNRERIKVRVEVDTLDLEYMSVGEVIKQMEDLRDRFGADARIYKYERPYSDSKYLAVTVERKENDEEYTKRIEGEDRMAKWREEEDKRIYERLKKVFGG